MQHYLHWRQLIFFFSSKILPTSCNFTHIGSIFNELMISTSVLCFAPDSMLAGLSVSKLVMRTLKKCWRSKAGKRKWRLCSTAIIDYNLWIVRQSHITNCQDFIDNKSSENKQHRILHLYVIIFSDSLTITFEVLILLKWITWMLRRMMRYRLLLDLLEVRPPSHPPPSLV